MSTHDETRRKLDKVSSCFCLAKWTQVTIHLESGTTHSCHHPTPQMVPLAEVSINPAALHNSQAKIAARKQMLQGQRPKECEYCWKVEDLKKDELSDRIIKSSFAWSDSEYENILANPLGDRYAPKYLEISFSHACNFKCSYCSANYSTKWEEELKKWGNYPTYSGIKTEKTYGRDEENPYVAAFWQWWPEIKDNLDTFRITGGEPLLSPNTFRILDTLIESDNKTEMTLGINSNLGVSDELILKLVDRARKVIDQKKVKAFHIYTSVDAHGARAEYIRNGLKYEKFWQNIDLILRELPEVHLTFMCTYNALSVSSFDELLKDVLEFNKKYQNSERENPIFLDISYLRYPDYQSVFSLTEDFFEMVQNSIEFIEKHLRSDENPAGFTQYQLIKLRRILEIMKSEVNHDSAAKRVLRSRFFEFFSEHDRRRETSFLNTFPEMKEFWHRCNSDFLMKRGT